MKDRRDFIIYLYNTLYDEDELDHALAVADEFYENSAPWKVGILHDIVEDGYKSFEQVALDMELDAECLEALKAITRNPGEQYFNYINRVKENELATTVKLADLKHNISRCIKSKNLSLKKRYDKATKILMGLNG